MLDRVLLIVEDDPDLRETWKDLFELSDYTVHAFASVSAALADTAAVRGSNMLITDYHLEDSNGIDLIRSARRINPDLPAVVLTGLRQDHVRHALASEPDVELFFKPVRMEVIENYIESRFTGGAA